MKMKQKTIIEQKKYHRKDIDLDLQIFIKNLHQNHS